MSIGRSPTSTRQVKEAESSKLAGSSPKSKGAIFGFTFEISIEKGNKLFVNQNSWFVFKNGLICIRHLSLCNLKTVDAYINDDNRLRPIV